MLQNVVSMCKIKKKTPPLVFFSPLRKPANFSQFNYSIPIQKLKKKERVWVKEPILCKGCYSRKKIKIKTTCVRQWNMMFITQTISVDIVISTITCLVIARISKWIKNNEKKANAVLKSHTKLFILSDFCFKWQYFFSLQLKKPCSYLDGTQIA